MGVVPGAEQTSRDIPGAIKRRLRREAGFGCCYCGFPFIEYHHIIPWSVVQEHNPSNMMALCPNCHAMATTGATTEREQRARKANPHNIERGLADGSLKLDQGQTSIAVGTSTFSGNVQLLRVDGEPLLSLHVDDEQHLLVSITVYDAIDDLLLLIDRNEWRVGDLSIWNVEYRFHYLKLQRGSREVTLEVDARHDPVRVRADLWKHGSNIRLGADGNWDVLVRGAGHSWGASPGMTYHNACIHVDTYEKEVGIGLGIITRP